MRSPVSAGVAAAAWLSTAPGLAGTAFAADPVASPVEPRRLTVSVSASVIRPGDTAVRELYGGTQTAFGLDCELQVRGAFALFAAGRFGTARGSTAVLPPQLFDESYGIELSTRSLHIGAALTQSGLARLRWTAGAGLAVGSYEERWPALGDPVRGSTVGIVGRGGAHYSLTQRVGLVGRLEWSFLRALKAADDGRNPNLGGLGLSFGASARF